MSDVEQDETEETGDILPVDPESPTPHLDKLLELAKNDKLPEEDKERIDKAVERYHAWTNAMSHSNLAGDEKIRFPVDALNDYKRSVEVDLIWDSETDFLFRQRGPLKLDNSIIEEFMPRLVDPDIIPALMGQTYEAGPRKTFAQAYFTTSLFSPAKGAGMQIRTKNQDFIVSRPAFIRASNDPQFPDGDTITRKIALAFVAAECKTNLDKTMFQEAVATAHDLKIAVPGSRYYLICEWLDMTPISTAGTDINEVIILRGKRMNSNVRQKFARSRARREHREWYVPFLVENPIRVALIQRFIGHLAAIFTAELPKEESVVSRGYF